MARAVLITGTIGTGKSTVAADVVEVFKERGLLVAAIDLDWLCWAHVDGAVRTRILADNLRAVASNFADVGVEDFVLVRAITAAEEVQAVRSAFDEVELQVVRLVAPADVVERRLRGRDAGAVLEEHLTETREIDRILDGLGIEDFTIENKGYEVRSVASELADRLGWT